MTSDTVWDLTQQPNRLVVLGGGTIGCELGQAFTRLGSTVTVVEALDRLLSNEDPDAARLVTDELTRDGATVLTGTPVTAVEGTDSVLGGGQRIAADRVLVALGRRPDTRDLGLETVGVDTDERGFVTVDEHLHTTNPRIWAAGDVRGTRSSPTSPGCTAPLPRPTRCSASAGPRRSPRCGG
nr:FAD-dependent oxidoreductase [Pseudonocardia nigra]